MEILEIWVFMGSHIHQDFLLDYPDFFSGISAIVRDLSAAQKEDLYSFLKELTSSKYTAKEQLEIWSKSGAEFFVTESQISDFLSEVFKTVENERSES